MLGWHIALLSARDCPDLLNTPGLHLCCVQALTASPHRRLPVVERLRCGDTRQQCAVSTLARDADEVPLRMPISAADVDGEEGKAGLVATHVDNVVACMHAHSHHGTILRHSSIHAFTPQARFWRDTLCWVDACLSTTHDKRRLVGSCVRAVAV